MISATRSPRGIPLAHSNLCGYREGFTLVELMVSMLASTMLMTGLAISLFVATRTFTEGSRAAAETKAAAVQATLARDLRQATTFVSRANDAVTFRVPDRNGDAVEETLSYSWTGVGTKELKFSQNGGPLVTLLEDVQSFGFDFHERSIAGNAPTLPPLDPSEWGMIWASGGRFGWDSVYPSFGFEERRTVATRVTLTESGTLNSISAYLTLLVPGGKSDVRFALYGVDNNDNPETLLASTPVAEANATGWLTIATPPVPLTPGEYYLALSIKKTDNIAYHLQPGVGETHVGNTDAVKSNFRDPFGSSSESNERMSIYASYTN